MVSITVVTSSASSLSQLIHFQNLCWALVLLVSATWAFTHRLYLRTPRGRPGKPCKTQGFWKPQLGISQPFDFGPLGSWQWRQHEQLPLHAYPLPAHRDKLRYTLQMGLSEVATQVVHKESISFETQKSNCIISLHGFFRSLCTSINPGFNWET